MRVREEDCNLVLLAGVTLVSVAIAGGAALMEPSSAASNGRPFYLASAATPAAENKPARLADPVPVRIVGAPFVPNTNPRER